MSTDRDTTRVVRSWLEEGATALPDRVLDSVLDQLPATRQRRSWWPTWRFARMNKPALAGIAAAAAVTLAVIGYNLLPATGLFGGRATPEPTPSPAASPLALRSGTLTAGTYVITPFGQPGSDRCSGNPSPSVNPAASGCGDPRSDDSTRITLAVPDGWAGIDTTAIWLAGQETKAPSGASLNFGRGAWLHSDPCLTEARVQKDGAPPDIPVGPTVDDFASAIADHPTLDATTPVDVTLAGYSGKYIDLQLPADISACQAYFPWEPGIYAQGPSQRSHLWILDVDGIRVVIQSMDYPTTSPQRQAELQAIVDSIQITP
jgi:hypothetical protein